MYNDKCEYTMTNNLCPRPSEIHDEHFGCKKKPTGKYLTPTLAFLGYLSTLFSLSLVTQGSSSGLWFNEHSLDQWLGIASGNYSLRIQYGVFLAKENK